MSHSVQPRGPEHFNKATTEFFSSTGRRSNKRITNNTIIQRLSIGSERIENYDRGRTTLSIIPAIIKVWRYFRNIYLDKFPKENSVEVQEWATRFNVGH